MQIFVNSQPLDYDLDKPATLNEIIENVQEWAQKSNMYILDYSVVSRENVPAPLTSNEIDKIDIAIGNSDDVIQKNIIALNEYIDKMGAFLASNPFLEKLSGENYRIVKEGLDYIKEALSQLREKVQSDVSLGKAIDVLEKEPNDLEIGEIIAALASARNHTMLWKKQYEYIRLTEDELEEKKSEFLDKIPEFISQLDTIAQDLTTGETSKAVTELEKWMVHISEGLNILTVTGFHLEKVGSMTRLLNNLTDALFDNDLVTAADIVDFDIREDLEQIAELSQN